MSAVDRLTKYGGAHLCTHRCISSLNVFQRIALSKLSGEARYPNALLAPFLFDVLAPAGAGRNVVSLLAPQVLPACRTAVLFVPRTLYEHMADMYKRLAPHFNVPSAFFDGNGYVVPGAPALHVLPEAALSRAEGFEMLVHLDPDFIIADLWNPKSARHERLRDFVARHDRVRVLRWHHTERTLP